jgi:hypothetical protein
MCCYLQESAYFGFSGAPTDANRALGAIMNPYADTDWRYLLFPSLPPLKPWNVFSNLLTIPFS